MGPRVTPGARQLLVSQRGVIASWQLPDVGMTTRQLSRAARDSWQRITPRTFVAGELPVTPAQMRTAAVLEAGPHAALSGCSGLIEAGWTGDDGGRADVLVARDSRSRSGTLPGWVRLRSTVDVPRRWGVPARTSAARAAIDAAAWARSPRERMFVLTSTVQQRLATTHQMRREIESRGRIPHSRDMRAVLEEVDGGVTSTGEATFLRECVRRGLPTPRMQVRRIAGGRRRRVDAEFALADGRLLIVEIDGAAHMEVAQWEDDLARQNDLVFTTGAIVLRVTTWQVRYDPDPFFQLLTAYFRL